MAVQLKVNLKIDGVDGSKKAFDSAKAGAASLASKVTALSTAYTALADIIGRVADVLSQPLEAAMEAESATFRLAQSLKIVNLATEANAKSMNDFADQMEVASGFQAELVQNLEGSNVMLLKNVANAEALTQASIALAKKGHIPLESANDMLVKSLNGEARALKLLVPGVAQFSDAQNRAGAAVRLVSEQFSSFIDGDMVTAEGQVLRLKNQFSQLVETIGTSILTGIESSGMFQRLAQELGFTSGTIEGQKAAWEQFGETLGNSIVESVKTLQGAFKILSPMLSGATWLFQKMLESVDLLSNAFSVISLRISSVYSMFKALVAIKPDRSKVFGYDMSGFNKYMDEAKQKAKVVEVAVDKTVGSFQKLIGVDNTIAKAKSPIMGLVKPKPFVNPKLGLSDADKDAEISIRRSLNQQLLSLQMEQENSLVAANVQAFNAINQAEEDAAKKGINVTKQVNAIKLALNKSFEQKMKDQRAQDTLEIARGAGNNRLAIQTELDNQVEAWRKMYAQGRIELAEYNEAVIEATRKAAIAQQNTTGSAAMDDATNKATTLINSVQGGIGSIISSIGSMFGPIGSLVAGVINLLNQSSDQFRAMLLSLLEAFKNLVPNIVSSISVIIEELPNIFFTMIGQLFTVSFWGKMIQSLWTGLINMFKNFWAYLFGGKLSSSAKKVAAQTNGAATFGSDDPNAGDGGFKIKDANLSKQRRAAAKFEDSFTDTVDEAGQGLSGMFAEAFQKLMDNFNSFFKGIFTAIENVFASAYNLITKAFKWAYDNVIAPIANVVKDAWTWVYNKIALPIYDLFASIFSWVRDKVFTPIVDAISGVFSWVWDNIFKPFVDLLQGTLSIGPSGGGGGSGQMKNVFTPSKWHLNSGGAITSGMSNSSVAKAMLAGGALAFANGGMVPGSGFRDSVPAVLTPGEVVLNRKQVQDGMMMGGGQNVSFTFNVAAGGMLDKEAIRKAMPTILEQLRRESKNGKSVVSQNGVY